MSVHDSAERKDTWKRTLEDADGGGEVVDAAGGLQSCGEDLDGGDEIVGEAVVEIPLDNRILANGALV